MWIVVPSAMRQRLVPSTRCSDTVRCARARVSSTTHNLVRGVEYVNVDHKICVASFLLICDEVVATSLPDKVFGDVSHCR